MIVLENLFCNQSSNSLWTRLFVLLIPILLSVAVFRVVYAHAEMVESEPQDGEVLEQAPKQAVARFDHELDSQKSSLSVFDAQGHQVDQGDGGVNLKDVDHKSMIASLPPDLGAGEYIVRWEAVSAEDGDPTQGEFTFKVEGSGIAGKTLEEASQAPSASSNWIILILVAGLALMTLLVILFLCRRGAVSPR